MYSGKVMDHFVNPRNVGVIEDADGIGQSGSPHCGDVMRIYIKVNDNIITKVRFLIFGCGSAIAAASMTTELMLNKTLEEAWQIDNKMVAQALDGLPVEKLHCSVLAEDVIHAAINDYRIKNGLEPLGD